MNTKSPWSLSFIGAILAVAMMAFGSLGCASESIARNVNYTHWHDDETVIFVYNRAPSAGSFAMLFNPLPTTTHVLICLVEENNAVRCKEQRQIANMLNPHAVDLIDLDDSWRP